MRKVTAFGHQVVLDDVVHALQQAGVLEITTAAEDEPADVHLVDVALLHRLEEHSARAEFVRDFLGRHREPDIPFSSFISEKFHLDEDRFLELEHDEAFSELYEETESISARIADIDRERGRLEERCEALRPWTGMHMQIEALHSTDQVSLLAGTVPTQKAVEIREQLRAELDELSVEELPTEGRRQAWVLMVHRDHVEALRRALSVLEFEEARFEGLHDYPAEELADAEERLRRLSAEDDVLVARATGLAEHHYGEAVALAEAMATRRAAASVSDSFASTQRTFILHGWVREDDVGELESAISGFEDVDLELADPDPEDRVPVALSNPRWLQPFEVLTDLYGRPRYGDVDPTPLMAGFFFLFFGLAIGDLGYGLSLAAAAWLIKHRLDVAPGVKKFMDLLMYGGAASMLVGVLTGSYFAIETDQLPRFLRALVILRPIDEVTALLVFTVLLGVVQVLFGVTVQTYRLWRDDAGPAAIAAEASTMLLWASIAVVALAPGTVRWALTLGLGAVVLIKGDVFTAPARTGAVAWDRTWGYVWIAVAVAWLVVLALGGPSWVAWILVGTSLGLVASKAVRASFLGVLGGMYESFNTVTGQLSDFLSYTRLAALGIASVLVGQVMNILAGLMPMDGAAAIIGILGAVLILVVGHAFNIVISLLGAFVHPLRLQFVEFFSKFYEGGGEVHRPFGYETKALVLRRRTAREEGGTNR